MKRELQSLASHLSHACKVVRPGRRFLRGVFGLLSLFRKRNHLVRLSGAFRADLEWWSVFAESWNGVSMMLDLELKCRLQVYTFGVMHRDRGAVVLGGFQVSWSEWPDFRVASIAAKELLPILVAAALLGRVLARLYCPVPL